MEAGGPVQAPEIRTQLVVAWKVVAARIVRSTGILDIWKAEPTRFADGLDERHEQKRVRMTTVSGMNNQKLVVFSLLPGTSTVPAHRWYVIKTC